MIYFSILVNSIEKVYITETKIINNSNYVKESVYISIILFTDVLKYLILF